MSALPVNIPSVKTLTDGVCAVVLAAGFSTRMGGEPKALLPLGGTTMLGMALRVLTEAGIERIRVVTGHGAEQVAAEALKHGAVPVHNPEAALGMYSSVCAGLLDLVREEEKQEEEPQGEEAKEEEPVAAPVQAVFLLPVDAAPLRPQSLIALLRAWRELDPQAQPGAVLLPSFAGRTGHPPLIGAAHIQPILIWQGDSQWQNQWQWRGGVRDYLGSLLRQESAGLFSLGSVPPEYEKPAALAPPAVATAGADGAAGADATAGAADTADTAGISGPAETAGAAGAAGSEEKPQTPTVLFIPLPDAGVLADLDTPGDYERARIFLDTTRSLARPLPEEAWEWLRHAGLSAEKVRHCLRVALGALRLLLALERAGLPVDAQLGVCGGLLHDIARAHKDHARYAQRLTAAQGWPECALVVGAHTVLPAPLLAALGLAERDLPVGSPPPAATDAPSGADAEPDADAGHERAAAHERADADAQFHQAWNAARTAAGLAPLDEADLTRLTDLANPAAAAALAREPACAALLHACAAVYMADKYYYGQTQVPLDRRFALVREHCGGNAQALAAVRHRERIARAVRGWFVQKTGAAPEDLLASPANHSLEAFLLHCLDQTA